MLDWPSKMKTWTILVLSAGLLSGLGFAVSAAETVPLDARVIAIIAMDNRAKALRVCRFLFFMGFGTCHEMEGASRMLNWIKLISEEPCSLPGAFFEGFRLIQAALQVLGL